MSNKKNNEINAENNAEINAENNAEINAVATENAENTATRVVSEATKEANAIRARMRANTDPNKALRAISEGRIRKWNFAFEALLNFGNNKMTRTIDNIQAISENGFAHEVESFVNPTDGIPTLDGNKITLRIPTAESTIHLSIVKEDKEKAHVFASVTPNDENTEAYGKELFLFGSAKNETAFDGKDFDTFASHILTFAKALETMDFTISQKMFDIIADATM